MTEREIRRAAASWLACMREGRWSGAEWIVLQREGLRHVEELLRAYEARDAREPLRAHLDALREALDRVA